MAVKKLILFLTLCAINSCSALTTTQPPKNFLIAATQKETERAQNETISQLLREQTQSIKNILNQPKSVDYPTVTKQEANIKDPSVDKDTESEELRVKCQHLLKHTHHSHTEHKPSTHVGKNKENSVPPAHGHTQKPELSRQQTKPPTPPQTSNGVYTYSYVLPEKPAGYNTSSYAPQASYNKQVVYQYPQNSHPNANNLQYVKLEPVMMQKTVLNDGRVLYYWYTNAPTVVPAVQAYNLQAAASDNKYTYITKTSTTPPTTTTTTEKAPSYDIQYSTSSTSERRREPIYKQDMKFIVPVPYTNIEVPAQFSRKFDPYAYYPEYLQPAVPYAPTYYMIRAISVPRDSKSLDGDKESLDDVSDV